MIAISCAFVQMRPCLSSDINIKQMALRQNQQILQVEGIKRSNQPTREAVPIKNFGLWTEAEQEKYIVFLEVFQKQIQNRRNRKQLIGQGRLYRIFRLMARFIQLRSGIQCRSHHIKQMRTHRKLKNIILHHRQLRQASDTSEQYRRILRNQIHLLPMKTQKIKKDTSLKQSFSPQFFNQCTPNQENYLFSPSPLQYNENHQPYSFIIFFIPCQFQENRQSLIPQFCLPLGNRADYT